MNVVDSSGWVEYLADGPGASFFAPAIENVESLLVPTIVMNEVLRKAFREGGEEALRSVRTALRQGRVVPLDERIAESAARLGVEFKLPLADALVLAAARAEAATLWTQDRDFEGIPGVRFQKKRTR